jgi:O-antigen/teichoic acid export membrane protein
MGQARLLANGVMINWTAYAVAVVVSFFLSPFVVHHLGNVAYGVWVLANSSIAYMALLDLGLRGAVTHFVAKHRARGEDIESSRAISVALGFRIVVSLLVATATLMLAARANRIFRIPSEMLAAAQWTIVIIGVQLCFGLIIGVFAGVLTALQRFGLASGLAIAQTLISAAGTVWVLRAGHGIVPLASMQLAVVLMLGIVTIALCFRVYRELCISFRLFDRKILRNLWRYSFYLFVIGVSSQIIYYTDNLVVGAFLSAEAVTFYAIGGRLIECLGQLGASLAQTVMPFASNLGAQGRRDQLRRLLIQGTRAAVFVSFSVGAALFFRGPTFIGLWMGHQYAQPSGRILRILLLSTLAIAGNRVAGNIVFGLGKHKPFALWQTCEAMANLVLSIFLVRRMGVEGVAWGTVLPSLLSQLIIWPRYISRLLDISIQSYFWEGWIRPGLATVPFCIACTCAERYWGATDLVHLSFQIATLLPLVPLGVAVIFWREINWEWQSRSSVLRLHLFNNLRRDSAS